MRTGPRCRISGQKRTATSQILVSDREKERERQTERERESKRVERQRLYAQLYSCKYVSWVCYMEVYTSVYTHCAQSTYVFYMHCLLFLYLFTLENGGNWRLISARFTLSLHQLTEEELEKERRRKHLNRIAARNHRKKNKTTKQSQEQVC